MQNTNNSQTGLSNHAWHNIKRYGMQHHLRTHKPRVGRCLTHCARFKGSDAQGWYCVQPLLLVYLRCIHHRDHGARFMHRTYKPNRVAADASTPSSRMRNDSPIDEDLRLDRHRSALVRRRHLVQTLMNLINLTLDHLRRANCSVGIKTQTLGIPHKQRK